MKTLKNFLLEARLTPDYLKQLHKDTDFSHDTLGQHKNVSDIVDHFGTHADPTKEKKYLPWIMNRYKEKNFRQEDAPRIKDALSNFDKHKPRLAQKDINQYKKLSRVEDAVAPHLGTTSGKEEKRQIKSEEAETIHNANGLSVIHPKTQNAATLYGANTRWCTASSKNNYFDHYNKEGPLYVVNTPDKKKFQFHFPSEQFMDAEDEPVKLHNMVDAYPELKNVKKFKEEPFHGHEFASNDKEFDELAHKSIDNLMKRNPTFTSLAQHNPSDMARNPNLKAEHLEKIIKFGWGNDRKVLQHPNLSQAQQHHLWFKSIGTNKDYNREHLVFAPNPLHPAVHQAALKERPHYMSMRTDLSYPDVQELLKGRGKYSVAKYHADKLKTEDWDKLASDREGEDVNRRSILGKAPLSHEAFHREINQGDPSDLSHLVTNPHVKSDHLHKIYHSIKGNLKDTGGWNTETLNDVVKHPNVSSETLNDVVKNGHMGHLNIDNTIKIARQHQKEHVIRKGKEVMDLMEVFKKTEKVNKEAGKIMDGKKKRTKVIINPPVKESLTGEDEWRLAVLDPYGALQRPDRTDSLVHLAMQSIRKRMDVNEAET